MLTFDVLRAANLARRSSFKALKDWEHEGDEWSLNDWMTALTGEVGETANILKKVRRGDLTLDQARPELEKEIGDIQTYLDLLCWKAGIDLAKATRDKWNEVSERHRSPMRIMTSGRSTPDILVDSVYPTDQRNLRLLTPVPQIHIHPLDPEIR